MADRDASLDAPLSARLCPSRLVDEWPKHVIHNRDGTVAERNSYGRDPVYHAG
jgi:hypothetical protein